MVEFVRKQKFRGLARTAARVLPVRGSRSAADFVWTLGSSRGLAPNVQAPTRGFNHEEGRVCTAMRGRARFSSRV